ncbi:fungal-specific transcription factor [Plectosphaerella plurivora]|uniref:Fungal-specific transcription factor n=1 Tax=Plectosphaerella plurivora TaxID=936078 RepID=A0A9P8V220_9PEZI|nr:fungal-specific transcription factor [Plectosphaerella plurivora]
MDDPEVVLRPSQGASSFGAGSGPSAASSQPPQNKKKPRRGADPASQKRRCVSTACIACRRRKSKCDGALPSCAACSSVYGTECVYDPNSDHRRKGVYREKIDSMKARTSTLQILIEAILNASEDEVPDIVKRIRTCDSLDTVAEQILKHEEVPSDEAGEEVADDEYTLDNHPGGEGELARKMGELRLENGAVRFIGGTSHLIYLGESQDNGLGEPETNLLIANEDPIVSWTNVTKDKELIVHLLNMYFNWHYTYFTTLSKTMFYRDFFKGRHALPAKQTAYCSPLLVNAMLALGCHFTSVTGAFGVHGDSRTKGDHFFAEAKRIIMENDEYERPRLTTVQALALMSVREAGCGREAKGWVYSGMSFRMAQDIGLNFDDGGAWGDKENANEQAVDARRMTFWGCFLFDKAWSNYMGRLPQIPKNSYNVPKFDVFPGEDSEAWSPYTDAGFDESVRQPSRTRAIALQLSKLCEISSDLLIFFYHPNHIGRSSGKAVELKKLSELHRRLEDWRKELPKELEPKDGQLPNVILMHMFFHLQYIHLFRPFLKYAPATSPLPPHVSPRRICTANAGAISKLMRLYKKTWNLRQICNIAVYMIHSACTIHILNLPEKTAKRDIIHGIKHLEEIAEDWLCARRSLSIISVLGRKWGVDFPEEALGILQRTDEKYGGFNTSDVPSPKSHFGPSPGSSADIGGSPTGGRSDHYGHMEGYRNGHIPQDLPPGTTADGMMSAPAMVGMSNRPPSSQPGRPRSFHQQQQGTSMPSMGLPDMGSWAGQAGMPQPPMSGYRPHPPQGYAAAGALPPGQRPRPPSVRGMAQSPQVFQGLEQDWFLNDGAKWHQNFEAWELGASPTMSSEGQTPQSMFMFQGGTPATGGTTYAAQTPQSDPAANGGAGRPASEDRSGQGGYDSLSSLSGNPAWLPPGLD